jgi:hypothetical protein
MNEISPAPPAPPLSLEERYPGFDVGSKQYAWWISNERAGTTFRLAASQPQLVIDALTRMFPIVELQPGNSLTFDITVPGKKLTSAQIESIIAQQMPAHLLRYMLGSYSLTRKSIVITCV